METYQIEGKVSYGGSFIELDDPDSSKPRAIDATTFFEQFAGQKIKITVEGE